MSLPLPHTTTDEELLGFIAFHFRGMHHDVDRRGMAEQYAEVVERLIRGGCWEEMPPPEDQLPDAWMPQVFFDYWSQP